MALPRIRFKLKIHRKERLLLSEEATMVAPQGNQVVASGDGAREMLNALATTDLAEMARNRFIEKAAADL